MIVYIFIGNLVDTVKRYAPISVTKFVSNSMSAHDLCNLILSSIVPKCLFYTEGQNFLREHSGKCRGGCSFTVT